MAPQALDVGLQYQTIHIEAYVVYVDMAYANAVAFKLTPETINTLVKLHRDVYSVCAWLNTWQWSEKENQMRQLQEQFNQDVNRFIFYTDALALEGIDEDGAGELLGGRSDVAKAKVKSLFIPLQPPYPEALRVLHAVMNTCHKESYIGGHNVTRKAYTDLFSVVSISHSRGLPVRDSKAF
ncbi:hypothetical protein KXV81_006514 [Aspergillus fumigatus]|nr:hypothetical protein KXX11_008965 [Aspergillus fumigatus]KMK54986.1 hypothetical protein Y699_09332 [Aspergillus fumigatus Z5]KAH1335559.1 hypothetical protein KXX67_004207 [Aspergillus fumigatus]KAH1342968.1 hypothetical protein KXX14_005811 [Aspergillus fumigatus]KAH1438667.1 hypothetical protein KXX68_006540 [Aspergillus fumigatus]